MWLGIAIIVAALVLPLLGISPEAYVLILCVLALVGVIATLVRGWTLANRLYREQNR